MLLTAEGMQTLLETFVVEISRQDVRTESLFVAIYHTKLRRRRPPRCDRSYNTAKTEDLIMLNDEKMGRTCSRNKHANSG